MLNISDQILYQSDTWSWNEELSDYPASTHTLNIYLKLASGSIIDLESTASGDTHVISYSAELSAAADPGVYSYQARVTNNSTGKITTIETGRIEIFKDLTKINDERGWLQKVVDDLESLQADYREENEVSINGRTVKYTSRSDVVKDYLKYKRMLSDAIKKERIKQGYDSGGKIKVEFR